MSDDAPSVEEQSPPSHSRLLRPGVILPSISAFVLISLAALLWIPQLLLDNWLAHVTVDAATVRLSVSNAAQVVLFSLGGLIALVGVSLSLSRHGLELETAKLDRVKEQRRVDELGQQRRIDTERELRDRFTQAVALLSDPDKATTRQAGVYALGALADDWINHGRLDEHQVCIDVLCGYVRSQWDPEDQKHAPDERRIRETIFALIGDHLRPDMGRPSWDGATFDLRGALIDYEVTLRMITSSAAQFNFREALIHRNARIQFSASHLSGGVVDFTGVQLFGGQISFLETVFSGANVTFAYANLAGGRVNFAGAVLTAHNISFRMATVEGALLSLRGAHFSGGTVDLDRVSVAGGEVAMDDAPLSSGDISTFALRLTDGMVKVGSRRFTTLDPNDPLGLPTQVRRAG